ncbi:MAG: hypothetical protein WAV72_18175, partial [Bradyrhizobium sp.]
MPPHPSRRGEGAALRMGFFIHARAIMIVPGTFSFDAPGDAARAAELRRVKALATLVLAATLALF